MAGMIRTGIGGWVFDPWRNRLYPPELKPRQHLAYAASRLGAIEINATFYRTQTGAAFRGWASEAPDGFLFAAKDRARRRAAQGRRGSQAGH